MSDGASIMSWKAPDDFEELGQYPDSPIIASKEQTVRTSTDTVDVPFLSFISLALPP